MKSLTGKFASSRGWALLLILFLGAGLLVSACGDEEVPAPTTPTPPPPPPAPEPEPEPEPEPPAIPTGVMASSATVSSITWTWNAVEGATNYAVQISADEVFGDEDAISLALTPTYTVSDLPPATTVYARVAAGVGTSLQDALLSGWSTHVAGMTALPDAPNTPENLRVTSRGEGFVEWTWDAVAGADGYRVQYSLDERFTGDEATAELAATDTSYRAENLAADMDIYLRVQSFVGTGAAQVASAWSTHVTGMTEPPAPMAPESPSGLTVSASGDDYIEWRWDTVSGADGYEVQFSGDVMFASDDPQHDVGAELTYRQSGLDYETRGYLRARAYTGSGADRLSSAWTEAATGLTSDAPPPPPSPAVPRIQVPATGGEGLVTWNWGAVDGAGGYQIWYSDNDAFTGTDPMEDLDNETLSYTRENLEAGTTHYLRVRSYIEVDGTRYYSEWTSQVSGQTDPLRPAVPTGLAVDAAATDHNSIGWTWDAVEGATSYEAQFSLTGTFTDTDQIFTPRSPSYAVHRLQVEADGYLQVRAVMGTGASATRSDWSEASAGKTTAEPEPDPLSIPANLRGLGRGAELHLSYLGHCG